MTINELRQKRNAVWEGAKAFLESHRNEKGVLSVEDDAAYMKMEKDITDLTREISRMERQEELGRAYSDKEFHSKIISGDCGGFYGRKVWHSTDEYRTVIFQCNHKFQNESRCRTPRLTEEEIKGRFLTAYNRLMGSRDKVLADCELIRKMLCNTDDIHTAMREAYEEMEVVSGLMQVHIRKNAAIAQSQAEYAAEAERLEKRYNEALERYTSLEDEKGKRKRRSRELKAFISVLEKQPLVITSWDERLWVTLLETATVQVDGSIEFKFKGGETVRM